jgi:prefoldin subunit 5
MRTPTDMEKEVEYLRNDSHRLGRELAEAKSQVQELTRERTKLMTWIDTLMYQIAKH